MSKEETKLGEISKEIRELNKLDVCTRGFMTFGCGCSECHKLSVLFLAELLKSK